MISVTSTLVLCLLLTLQDIQGQVALVCKILYKIKPIMIVFGGKTSFLQTLECSQERREHEIVSLFYLEFDT